MPPEKVPDDFVRELRDVIAAPRPQPTRAVRPVAPPSEPTQLHPLDAFVRTYAQQPTTPPMRPRRRLAGLFTMLPWFVGAGVVIGGLLYVSQFGLRAKGRIVQRGSAAIAHIMDAKADAERLDWPGAQANFDDARREFDAAGRSLGLLGPFVTGLLAQLPGLHSLQTGHDLTTAGRLLSEAGSEISQALATLGRSGESSPGAKNIVLTGALDGLDKALVKASADIEEADKLLQRIDPADLPENSRQQFVEFRSRLPAIRELVAKGARAVDFARQFMGEDRPRRYLVLFQNSSELRPTGGFPGSYGLLTTEGGRVKDWRADDIYNPDGQIKELIAPPLQLQHITPGWGMRDANWFADFALSGQKVMEYWRRGGGEAVDGVLAIRPEILASVLAVTGPVSLPEYDVVLTPENMLTTLQTEVEENRPSGKPKQIISDLAPVILDRLAALPAAQWPPLLNALAGALERRDVLMRFTDARMQEFADDSQWSGRVLEQAGDYLMVVISNIKGAKADAVTDTAMKLESRLENGTLVHRLTLKRQHDGGTTPYGFYNKTNYSYVRVLTPRGSTLRGIIGNDHPNNRPGLDYAKVGATRDPDLERMEATYQYDRPRDTITYEESNKTGFGFWMKVEPGQTSEVQLEYVVPASAFSRQYSLYVQRQPGLEISDFEFTMDKPALMVGEATPSMTEWPDSWRLHDGLDRDLHLEATMR